VYTKLNFARFETSIKKFYALVEKTQADGEEIQSAVEVLRAPLATFEQRLIDLQASCQRG